MSEFPSWQFNEMNQVGVDYAAHSEVESFDVLHGKFRNVKQENEDIIKMLSIQKEHSVIEVGTATGAFALQVAEHAKQVYAVDVSRAMLDHAQQKATNQAKTNILFCHGGFLTYEHSAEPVDFIVTSLALHHLPDFWKGVALHRLNEMLKPRGRLFLYDVVYSELDHEANILKWIAHQKRVGGEALANDVETHIREEYSTFTWIMEGLLEKAGFNIDTATYKQGVLAKYVCTK